jgi:protease IV
MAADVTGKRRPHPLLVALAVVGVLTLATVGAVLALIGFAISKTTSLIPSSFGMGAIEDHVYFQHFPKNERFVAGIKIEGEIQSKMADGVLEKLKQAEKDSRVVGILLDVDSPGGAVVPSQEMYDAVNAVKVAKPVVAYVRSVAASGAFYTIAPASKIVANRGSMLGSVGVIMSSFEATDLFAWLKLKPVTLKTGKLKDAGNPARPWTDEDKAYLQNMIDQTRGQFVSDVKTARNLPDITMNHLADGRVVLGTEALDLKLIDQLGNRDVALNAVAELAKVTPVPELHYMEEAPERLPIFMRYFMEESGKSFASGVSNQVQKDILKGTENLDSSVPKMK